MMFFSLLLLIAGLALIIFGADWLVDGASVIARKVGVSEFAIGLTIVGFGTSMPELVVSLNGAFSGVSDIAVGNVVGSNIFNTLFILGLSALVLPIGISEDNRRRDIPVTVAVTVLLICTGMRKTLFGIGQDEISRPFGLLFLVLFALYLIYTFKTDKKNPEETDEGADAQKNCSLWLAAVLVIAGLGGLVLGGHLFVDSAQDIAKALGVSDRFIAITVLAGGTSLPELATCIVAAIKKRGQLALGNILGSNVFNILLILGCSSLVKPVSLEGMNFVDMLALFLSISTVALGAYAFDKNKLGRLEGAIMLVLFAVYYVFLFTVR